jgi:hypothetical protein
MDILKGFVRDPITQAVINKDEKNYKDHIFKMELYKELGEIRNEIQFLREELGRTKALLANSEEKN